MKPAASITQLLRASSDDEKALHFALEDSSFGFHAQQAVEKLYKALLAHHAGEYRFTHDLKALKLNLQQRAIELPACSFRLEELSEYAGNARYDDPMPLNEETRQILRECISNLRLFVVSQIDAMQPVPTNKKL